MIPPAAASLAQLGSLPWLRLVGFGVVVLVAVALLAVAIRHEDPPDPVYEEDDDGASAPSTPRKSYGLTGSTDVTEVLEVDEEEGETGEATDHEYEPFDR